MNRYIDIDICIYVSGSVNKQQTDRIQREITMD